MRTSISMLALAALSASYDYCQSLGHDRDDIAVGIVMILWAAGFLLGLVRDFQETAPGGLDD